MGLRATSRVLTKGILRWLRKRAYTEDNFRQFITASGFHLSSIVMSATGFEITLAN
ncbi:MAG: hypothetical protein WA624_23445 [Methylocella sp.]